MYNYSRVVSFDVNTEYMIPYPCNEFVSKYDLKEVAGKVYVNEETFSLYVLQPAKPIVENEDIFVNSQGDVFSVGFNPELFPEKLTKEV